VIDEPRLSARVSKRDRNKALSAPGDAPKALQA
jgi:hypothetical protein